MSSQSRENPKGRYGVSGGPDKDVSQKEKPEFDTDINKRKDIPDRLPTPPEESL